MDPDYLRRLRSNSDEVLTGMEYGKIQAVRTLSDLANNVDLVVTIGNDQRRNDEAQRLTAWIAPDLIQHCDPLCRCGEIAPKSPRKRAIWYRRINRFNSTWLFFLGRSRCIERTSDPCDRRRAGGGRYEIHPITVCFGRRPTADGHGARGSKYQMGKPASRSSARLPVGGTVRTRHAFGGSRLH